MLSESILPSRIQREPWAQQRRRRSLVVWVAIIAAFATQASACGGGGSSTGPKLPMGDTEASAFSYTSELTDPATVWEGNLFGLLETGMSQFTSETGKCLVLLGQMTPTAGPAGPKSNPSVLSIDVESGGETNYSDDNKCETQAIQDAGYGFKLNGVVPIGTTYPFFLEFFFPGDSTATIDTVTVGIPPNKAEYGSAQYFEPTVLTEIPPAPS